MALRSPRFAGNARLQSAAQNAPPLRKGASGDAVRLLQQGLVDVGFPMPITTNQGRLPPDGIYGDETMNTVAKFQDREGLQRDGVAGHDTLHRLDELLAAPPPVVTFPPDYRNWAITTARKSPS